MKKIFLFIALAAFTASAQTPTETFNLTTLQPLQGTNWNFDANNAYDSRPDRFPPDGRVVVPTLFVNDGANLRITGTSDIDQSISIRVEGQVRITLDNAVNRRTGTAVVIDFEGRFDHPWGTVFPAGAPFYGLPSYYHRTSPMHLVTEGTHLTLTLIGTNELAMVHTGVHGSGWNAGLGVPEGTSVVIQGDGELTATGGTSASGIGGHQGGIPLTNSGGIALGHRGRTAGNITINSGTIIANSGRYGAGIGSGSNVRGGIITINGGDITANGIGGTAFSVGGAGIGGGGIVREWTNPLEITINGGTVRATGGFGAAGIGTGQTSTNITPAPMTININDGNIRATSGDGAGPMSAGAAGIGGGMTEPGENINIRGGTIIAVGGGASNGGAGIGGGGGGSIPGAGGHSGNINISGGTIYARGGTNAEHIGNGASHAGQGRVRISPAATISNTIPAE